jgi:hypothetical protein
MMDIFAAVKETHAMVYNTASCVVRTASVANILLLFLKNPVIRT